MRPETASLQEATLTPSTRKSLQEQIQEAQRDGITKIILDGVFEPKHLHQFSLLTVPQSLILEGKNNAVLDGGGKVAHVVFVQAGSTFHASGITITGGNTHDALSQISPHNHPEKKLNFFAIVDGAGISCGAGSDVELKNVLITGNKAIICGGGISNLGGAVKLDTCVVEEDEAGDTGAGLDNLVAGGVVIISNSVFRDNHSNGLGKGKYGSVTTFPWTYTAIHGSDFSGEIGTAIDYQPNSRLFIMDCRFNEHEPNPIVFRPRSNSGTRIEIPRQFLRLLAQYPQLIKLEGLPKLDQETHHRHRTLYSQEISNW